MSAVFISFALSPFPAYWWGNIPILTEKGLFFPLPPPPPSISYLWHNKCDCPEPSQVLLLSHCLFIKLFQAHVWMHCNTCCSTSVIFCEACPECEGGEKKKREENIFVSCDIQHDLLEARFIYIHFHLDSAFKWTTLQKKKKKNAKHVLITVDYLLQLALKHECGDSSQINTL